MTTFVKSAVLGIAFGVAVIPVWGWLTGQFGFVPGVAGGIIGGLVGGSVWGAGSLLGARARAQ